MPDVRIIRKVNGAVVSRDEHLNVTPSRAAELDLTVRTTFGEVFALHTVRHKRDGQISRTELSADGVLTTVEIDYRQPAEVVAA